MDPEIPFWRNAEVGWRSDRRESHRISACKMHITYVTCTFALATSRHGPSGRQSCTHNDEIRESRPNYGYKGQVSQCSRHIVHLGWDG